MKNLFCRKLAACMFMKQPSSSAMEPPIIYIKKVGSVDITGGMKEQYDNLTGSTTNSMENEETKTLLRRMCHLLDIRAHKEEEHRYEADKEDEMKNDWMLAAAVLDRICAIAVTVFYVVGTVVLFVIFAEHS